MTSQSIDQDKKLAQLLKSSNWQKIQQAFSAMTGLSVLTYDTHGNLYFEPSQENPICQTVQLTAKGQQHCKDHCTKHAILAANSQQTLFFKCEANLHVFSFPVSVDDEFKLILLGGKTHFNPQEFEDLRRNPDRVGTDEQRLIPLAKEIRLKDPHFLQSAAQLLQRSAMAVLEGVYYRQKFRTRLSQLMTLFTIFAEMRKELAVSELYTLVLHSIGVLFDISTAAIFIKEQDGKPFKTAQAFGRHKDLLRTYQAEISNDLLKPVQIVGRYVFTDSAYELLKSGFPQELRSAYFFTLSSGSSGPQVLLAVFDTAMEEEALQTLSAFSAHIGQLVENQSLQEELKQQVYNLKIWMEVMKAIGSALDSDDLFQIILDKSTEYVEAEQGSLMLLDREEQELSIKVTKGLHRRIVEGIRIKPGEGISGKVLESRVPLIVKDLETDERVLQEKRPRYKTKSFISLPLKLNDRIIGVLNVADKISGEMFSEYDLHLLSSIAAYASVAIERSEYYERSEELKKISITDPLTGLLNRRYFQERLTEEMERSRRHKLPLSLIIMDADDFKIINDTFGHQAGDEALKGIARCIRNSIRTIDVAARYGGEEFTVILPQTSKQDATVIAERICLEVTQLEPPPIVRQDKWPFSVSLGLTTFPEDAATAEDFIRNADTALYAAKTQGKNRVVVYRQTGH
jgi:diguanylate cyclase (GGDEF)-like protein